jgi:hypothetical protein
MSNTWCGRVLLAGACTLAGVTAWGQAARPSASNLDVAVVYHPIDANLVGGAGFWMQGAGVQVEGRFWRGMGVVADVSLLHTGDMNNQNVGLDLVTATFGPRYTWSPRRGRSSCFGQFLLGEVNGLHSVFPGSSATTDTANSLAYMAGGGLNLRLQSRLSVRAFEANWLRTQLPNSTTNVQNNLRLGAGVVVRF